MNTTATAQKCILVALAHPDDESFGMGGTLAYYADRGVAVHLVCATRGESGMVDPEFLQNYDSIAELREAELHCAAKALGLSSVSFLDYRDSGMAGSRENQHPEAFVNAPMDEVVKKLVSHIRRLKPQVILTFDATGGYHHPDHIYIHQATEKAFHAAGDVERYPQSGPAFAPEKLYYNALSRRRLRWLVRVMPLTGKDPSKIGRNQDIDLTVLARDADTPPHVTINYRNYEDQKRVASECHASQLGGGFPRNALLEVYYRLFGRRDNFTRAFPSAAVHYRAKDLFAD